MASLTARTAFPFELFKARLDQSLAQSPAARRFRATWSGRRLTITGGGCWASGVYDNGWFIGSIDLNGPALLMRRHIYSDMGRMLRYAGCDEVRVR